jgi:hypothetical protein
MLGRDVLRVVIEIAATVRPMDIVEQDEWKVAGMAARDAVDELELMVDRIPIVVSINKHRISRAHGLEDVETSSLMEYEPSAGLLRPGLGVELRMGIDCVNCCARSFGKLDQVSRVSSV